MLRYRRDGRLANSRSRPGGTIEVAVSVGVSHAPTLDFEHISRGIGLVGCVKEKASTACSARDLCLSSPSRGRRKYVEHSCAEWRIRSTLHGLVHPVDVLVPYDVTVAQGHPVGEAPVALGV